MPVPYNPIALAFLREKLSQADYIEFLTKDGRALATTELDHADFSIRTSNLLRTYGIKTIQEAVTRTEKDYLRIPHFHRNSLNELKDWLEQRGWRIGEVPNISETA